MLFFVRSYTATVIMSTTKSVTCENCDRSFTYQAVRKTQGFADSLSLFGSTRAENRALTSAEHKCKKALAKAVNIVPCPHCFWHQKNMVALGKRRRLFYTWAAALVASWLMLFWEFLGPSGDSNASGIPATVVFFGPVVVGIAWFFTYNPNRGITNR